MQSGSNQLERGSMIGGYRIDEVISRGGMGIVYRVTHVTLNRIYALKVLAPELSDDGVFRERFKREIRIAASLDHPHVVGIHYAGEHEGHLFLVMDLVYGTDLRELLRRSGALEPGRAVELLTQVASALDAAHAKGLVHRDVKPANVLITVHNGEERAYLTDFGLAKRSDSVAALTQKGLVVGSVDYMSPEQVTGGATDARTDVYALGCMFFSMVTGEVPYARDNSVATLFAHVYELPPPISGRLADLYPMFTAVIDKAMAKSPDGRYLSAGDFARDATAALSGMRYTGPGTVVATGDASLAFGEETFDRQGSSARSSAAPAGRQASQPPSGRAPAALNTHAISQGGKSPEPPAGPGRSRRRWKVRYRWPALAGLVVLAGMIAAVITLNAGNSSNPPAADSFGAALRPVPTNRVAGSGTATLVLRGNVASVTVDTNGLLDAVHLMHIHGGTGNCPPPSAAQTVNGHQFIGWNPGLKFYGQVVASLTTHDDTEPDYNLKTSLYPSGGNIRYKRTFTLGAGVASEIKQGLGVIVVHGIDYNGNGFYDNSLGAGAEAKAPALCGPLEPANIRTTANEHLGAKVYTASLERYAGPTTDGPVSPLPLLCHLTDALPNLSPPTPESRGRAPT